MNIILFFTYDISLKDWEKSGLLSRELKFYEEIHKKYDVEFTFITFGDANDRKFINLPFIEVIPVYEYINYSKNRYLRFIKSFLVPFKLRDIFKKASLLKTNQLLGSWVAILTKLIFRKKLIIRTGYDLVEFSKKNNKGFLKIFVYKLLTMISLKYADIYLASSKSDVETLTIFSPRYRNKIQLRPNWVQLSESISFSNRLNDHIISIGRLEKQKNISTLVSYFQNSDFVVNVYGMGSLKNSLLNEAKNKNVNLEIHEPIQNNKLLEKLKKYKFYISTSLFEGNPKSILEAMASGCVVLAIKNKNLIEIIDDNYNGIFINEDTNLVELLKNLQENEEKWDHISKNAIQTIKDNFLLKNIIEKEYLDYKK